jgi:hypothetical protein
MLFLPACWFVCPKPSGPRSCFEREFAVLRFSVVLLFRDLVSGPFGKDRKQARHLTQLVIFDTVKSWKKGG